MSQEYMRNTFSPRNAGSEKAARGSFSGFSVRYPTAQAASAARSFEWSYIGISFGAPLMILSGKVERNRSVVFITASTLSPESLFMASDRLFAIFSSASGERFSFLSVGIEIPGSGGQTYLPYSPFMVENSETSGESGSVVRGALRSAPEAIRSANLSAKTGESSASPSASR